MGFSDNKKYGVLLANSATGSAEILFLPYKVGTNVFATSSDWTPAAADFKITKYTRNTGTVAEASITNTPVWSNGRVKIILTATELTCDFLSIRIENAAINSDEIQVKTFGNSLAGYPTSYEGGGVGPLVTSGTAADQIVLLGAQTGKVDVGRLNGFQNPLVLLQQKYSAGYSGTYGGANATNNFDLPAALPLDAVGMTLIAVSGAGTVRGRAKIVALAGTTVTLHTPLAANIINGDIFYVVPEYAPGINTANGYGWSQVRLMDTDSLTNNAIAANAISGTKIAAGGLNGKGDWSTATALTAVATQITNLNNLSALANLYGPASLEIDDAVAQVYPFTMVVRDNEGKLVDLDANPAIAVTNAVGTDRSANLSAIAHPSTGRYTFTYTVPTNAAEEGLRMTATGAIGAELRYVEWIGATVNYETLTLWNAIYNRLGAPTGASIAADVAAVSTKLGAPAGASIAADIASVKTDTSTLAGRITATLFAGITSLSNWLRAGKRKANNDATAVAEINANNGTGIGTFDPTTDSEEAIRDRGDAAWTTGAGGGGGGAVINEDVTIESEEVQIS